MSGVVHRAGLLIPSSNTTVEYEYNRFGPTDLSWHAGRLGFTILSLETVASQEADLLQEAEKLATAQPALMLICQSAISFVLGADEEQRLVDRIAAASGIPVLSLAAVMEQAVRALGITRIALATPFPSGVDTTVAAYFAAAGFTVVRSASLGLSGNFALSTIAPERLMALVRDADSGDVEAVVIPGGNLRTLSMLDALEAGLGKPVLTTNQVGLWAVSGTMGVAPRAIGRLSGHAFPIRIPAASTRAPPI